MPQTKLKLLDLFSGLGGFSLGLESTGFFETIAFVEKDEFCQKVLKKNFKNIPIEGDIRNVKGERYAAEIISGGFPCQPFQLQEKEKEQMTIDTSGMKLLESLENVNQNGSLAKMLKVLLTSKTAWYSDRCKTIWKKKVSKSNVLLFQLQASVLGIKEKESGLSDIMYPTPTQDSASERTKKYKQGGTPLPMAVKMFPTPSASCQMDVVAPPETVKQNSKGWSVTRVGTGTKFGAKLNDVVNKIEKMYPTPSAIGTQVVRLQGKHTSIKSLEAQLQENLVANSIRVEFLMGYPLLLDKNRANMNQSSWKYNRSTNRKRTWKSNH